jgi:predicted AlkP superfamily pyrophosphatase or phosphodiesterase
LAVLSALLSSGVAASAAPKLLLIVSVDQMRAAYLTPSSGAYTGGLARLQREGFVYDNARHLHVPTETGPGHAVILTGRFPDTTGIAANHWFDRSSGSATYCVADSVFGLGPEHLWGYTLGDALKARDPESRVVSVSLKDRAAILLGGKRPDAALWYSSKTGEFTTSSYYRTPSWLGKFNHRLRDAGEPLHSGTTAYWSKIAATPEADRMVLELALEAAKRFKLGRDEHPDILAVSFSATDYIGHRYDADSPEMAEQLRRLDDALGRLMEGAERLAGGGRVDLVLTADHGAPQHARRGKRVGWEDLEAAVERALQFDFPAKQRWLLDFEYPLLYLNRAQAQALGLDWRQFLAQAAKRLAALDGMAAAYIPDQLDPHDPFAAQYARGYAPGRTGDIVLRPQEGVVVVDPPDVLDHGTPYDYDATVPLVFWGPDFKTGRSSETARVADLAPTAGAVLGVPFSPLPDSRVLPVLK